MKTLIDKIAGRLSGMHEDDLTTAERQITKLLMDAGRMTKDDHGNLLDEDVITQSAEGRLPPNTIESTFVRTICVQDVDTGLDVEVEIRKMASGPMVGFDASYLDQLGPGENPFSPYDDGRVVNVPDDEDKQ